MIYRINAASDLDRIFYFAQERGLDMYKTRLWHGVISWVIAFPLEDKTHTRFLLEFSSSVEPLEGVF